MTETLLMHVERAGIRRPSFAHIDWALFISALLLSLAGLITMNSFSAERYFFDRQLMWIGVSVLVFFVASISDWRFLRRTSVVVSLFAGSSALLLLLMVFGTVAKGAQSWFDLGGFSFQPSDPVKLVLITVLAKYFSRRHVEIAHIRHIILSAAYAAILALLILIQPDFGSAIIFAAVWFGMVLLSGISKKHLLAVLGLGAAAFAILWLFVFQPYQKQRIITFIHPLADIRGAGYNAFQSTIAVGSGQIMGKGIGFGTQSKLQFLPEYETDFIFAAFAEEWGLVGSILVFVLFAIVIGRLISSARTGASNFETLFSLGLAVLFLVHIIVHVGMNIGLLPVTGTTVPFMSYGGSHLLTEFLGIGIVTGMRKYRRGADRTAVANELPGLYGA